MTAPRRVPRHLAAWTLPVAALLGGCLAPFSPPQARSADDAATDAAEGADVRPTDLGPRDLGPEDAAPRDQGPSDQGLRDLGHGETGPRDLGEEPDTGPPPAPPCPARDELCGPLQPGCWQDPACPNCPLTGCQSEVPAPGGLVLVTDECGGARLHLLEADPRLGVADVQAFGAQDRVTFSFLVDGRRVTECVMTGLPTGAIRYEVICSANGQRVGAAVYEPATARGCSVCPLFTGCYRLRGEELATLLPQPVPDEVRLVLEQQGCRLQGTLLGFPDFPINGLVEPDGTVSLLLHDPPGLGASCTTTADGAGPSALHCTVHFSGRPDAQLTGTIERRPPQECRR